MCFDGKGRYFERKKVAALLDFVQITAPTPPPLPPIWTTFTTFCNAKKVDLSDIQNDSLSKILFKFKGRILALWVMYTI